ncbi:MAG: valine--tRNA ligase [Phycisphaera sp.]|nr:valine--tRNA ligase [Phycisphaera sp.]
MTTELPPKYAPAEVEPHIAQRWADARAFAADPTSGGAPYCIVIPPPNVTAALHLGHALNNTLQDILIRYHRMLGDNTLWMPGTDHAGIATQTVVDKRLQSEGKPALKEHKKLEDSGQNGREKFIALVQAWKDEYEQRILGQLKAMGCSCDWQRTRFTMDDTCAKAVREAFFRLFKDGLIYRGKRLVNWDPATQTALADDEVEMEEIDGHFYYLKYPLEDGSGTVTVATTRPETMLGDTAVAMNPKDPRAPGLRGKKVRLPIVNRVVPIIEDEYVVLPNPAPGSGDEKARYSSGFLKVTPAHDPNDYELGRKHNLPTINIMAPDGTISDQHGWPPEDFKGGDAEFLLGLDRFEARKAVVEWFRSNNLLEEVKPYRHTVGHSYRSHVPVEPYLSDQWYVKVTDDRLAGAALRALETPNAHGLPSVGTHAQESMGVQYSNHKAGDGIPGPAAGAAPWEGTLRFTPERYANTFRGWHENIRDWCISRQLWWGHRIPVWKSKIDLLTEFNHVLKRPEYTDTRRPNPYLINFRTRKIRFGNPLPELQQGEVIILHTVRPLPDGGIEHYYCPQAGDNTLEQFLDENAVRDPDVLDTWFSSALWPISTMGWPNETTELKTWNPSNVLCTAREIITLWVSRMVMFNLYFRGCLPFTDVFIHAMIQDGEGRKMSKSLGNGVDPIDIIHTHGSDAMRYTLTAMTTHTQDVRMPVEKDAATGRNTSPRFDLGRNFANKLWNAVRFALSHLTPADGDDRRGDTPALTSALSLPDKWVLSRLAHTADAATMALNQFQFSVYAQTLYDFVWRDFCDWYLEAIKPTVKQSPAQRRVLAACLDVILRLLHPVMPFITEQLWEALGHSSADRSIPGVAIPPSELCIKAAWPRVEVSLLNEEAEREFEMVQGFVGAIREVRTTYKVPPRQKVEMSAKAPPHLAQRALPHRDLVESLTNTIGREIGPKVEKPADAAATLVGDMEIYLHGLIDADEERARLTKRIADVEKSIAALNGRLSNKAYIDKAPAHLVQQTRDQLVSAEKELETLNGQMSALK